MIQRRKQSLVKDSRHPCSSRFRDLQGYPRPKPTTQETVARALMACIKAGGDGFNIDGQPDEKGTFCFLFPLLMFVPTRLRRLIRHLNSVCCSMLGSQIVVQ